GRTPGYAGDLLECDDLARVPDVDGKGLPPEPEETGPEEALLTSNGRGHGFPPISPLARRPLTVKETLTDRPAGVSPSPALPPPLLAPVEGLRIRSPGVAALSCSSRVRRAGHCTRPAPPRALRRRRLALGACSPRSSAASCSPLASVRTPPAA